MMKNTARHLTYYIYSITYIEIQEFKTNLMLNVWEKKSWCNCNIKCFGYFAIIYIIYVLYNKMENWCWCSYLVYTVYLVCSLHIYLINFPYDDRNAVMYFCFNYIYVCMCYLYTLVTPTSQSFIEYRCLYHISAVYKKKKKNSVCLHDVLCANTKEKKKKCCKNTARRVY